MRSEAEEDPQIEGFISCELQISPYSGTKAERDDPLTALFEPRYILGTPMLRKEPSQCYVSVADIPARPSVRGQPLAAKRTRLSLFELENSSQKYRLVYSRFKNPFSTGPRLAFSHEVTLKLANYKHCEYTRILRSFRRELSQAKTEGDTLIIQSRFQGGNLLCGFRNLQENNCYTLFMQNDTNSYGYNQWFYFSVRNAIPGTIYTFRIANFRKKYSFFKKGMQPVVFSLKQHELTGNGWSRDGFNFNYYQTDLEQQTQGPIYTLEFQLTFEHENDYVTVSANPPYSYSRLISFLTQYTSQLQEKGIGIKMKSAGRTIAGNFVPFLTISQESNEGQEENSKPSIVILARQHSGEIWSSFLMEELLNEIASDKPESRWLLQKYNIRVIPMANVDGVIYGNFRCDVAGYDLNRCWRDPSEVLHPQICKMRSILEDICEQSRVELCFDLHTHSKQMGIFGYCCEGREGKMVPMLISRLSPLFRYRACTFGITRDKQSTARAALYEMSNGSNVITIEMSTFGFVHKQTRQGLHFGPQNMKEFAAAMIACIYKDQDRQDNNEDIFDDPEMLQLSCQNEYEEAVSGSDSEPEADEITIEEKIKRVFPKSFTKALLKKAKTVSKRKGKAYSIKKKIISRTQTSVDTFQIPPGSLKAQYRYQQSQHTRKPEYSITNSVFFNNNSPKKLNNAVNVHNMMSPSNRAHTNDRSKSKKLQEKKNEPVQWKPLNTMQFSLKNLPIFAKQTLPQPYQSLASQNHSIMMTSMSLPTKQRDMRKEQQKKSNVVKPNTLELKEVIEEEVKEFPYLCVLSQKKRSEQLQKIRERRKVDTKRRPNLKKQMAVQSALERYTTLKEEKYSINKQQKVLGKITQYSRAFANQEESRRLFHNLSKFKVRLSRQHPN